MLFNSVQFAIFFPVVTLLYFIVPHRARWSLLLVASCGFYMAFIPVYILILLLTISIDYVAALYMERLAGTARRIVLLLSIVSTCLVLFVFKYFNFFTQNLQQLAHLIGWNYPIQALEIILPIGLSFHTFQSLSYVLEVYRGNQRAERHFGIYSLYVLFYPQLVAGPIERPQNLLHQFREAKPFNYDNLKTGLRLMAWGLFKKVVIADRLAIYVNEIYADPTRYTGPTLALATLAFAYQIYCDFSGYSDIAIGAARVMGFDLMRNFDSPYYSRSIGEFWRRWHISLSTWFRDYVYVPLGGSRVPRLRLYCNLLVTFMLSGIWHGANWTFIIWGALNGVYLIVGHIIQPWRARVRSAMGLPAGGTLVVGLQVAITFTLTCIAWVFFRSNSVGDAWHILRQLPTGWTGTVAQPTVSLFSLFDAVVVFCAIGVVESVQLLELYQRQNGAPLRCPLYLKWPAYYALLGSILVFGVFDHSHFIYFQF